MINAWGGVKNDLDKAISIFESISTHPNTLRSLTILPDAVTFEALINVFVAHRRTDLIPQYIERLKSLGVHMTAYIANCLIRGYAAVGDLERARAIFDSLLDPPEGIAAPNNHAPHEPSSSTVPPTAPVYREVSS
jgi:pentatricopeptide repeat protein